VESAESKRGEAHEILTISGAAILDQRLLLSQRPLAAAAGAGSTTGRYPRAHRAKSPPSKRKQPRTHADKGIRRTRRRAAGGREADEPWTEEVRSAQDLDLRPPDPAQVTEIPAAANARGVSGREAKDLPAPAADSCVGTLLPPRSRLQLFWEAPGWGRRGRLEARGFV
jgi:hypothetical protein